MDQLLGLHTSPNSLQLPPGATLKAENVYLDTDGYFKPFKKVEKAFPDSVLIGYGGSDAPMWDSSSSDTKNFKLFFFKNRFFFFNVNSDNDILGKYRTQSLYDVTLANYVANLNESTFIRSYNSIQGITYPGKQFFSNAYYPSVTNGNLYSVGLESEASDSAGILAFLDIGQNLIDYVSLNCPPPHIYAASSSLPPSIVYDGDEANETNRWYAYAYRFTLSINVGGYLVESKPTGSLYLRGSNNNSAPGIWLTDMFLRLVETVNPGIQNDTLKLNIYRTPLSFANDASSGTLTPRESEDFRLVATISYPGPTYEYDDSVVMPPGSSQLYTNPGQDGIIKQNEQPPLHKCSSSYKGFNFYGNIKQKPYLILDVKQGNFGIFEGYFFVSSGGPLVGTFSLTNKLPSMLCRYRIDLSAAANNSNFTTGILYGTTSSPSITKGILTDASSEFYCTHLNTSGTGVKIIIQSKRFDDNIQFTDYSGTSIPSTYASTGTINKTITTSIPHGMSTGDFVYIRFTTGAYADVVFPGTISNVISSTQFIIQIDDTTITSGNCEFYSGETAATGFFTADKNEKHIYPNGLAFSKFQQPFSVTLDQLYQVGSDDEILFLANLREYLLIFKNDGIYILKGDDETSFTVDPLYLQLKLVSSSAAVVVDDYVYAVCTIGVVRVNINGYDIISQPIRDDIQNMVSGISQDGTTTLLGDTFMFYYKSKRIIFIGREKALVEPDDPPSDEGLFANYYAHKSFCYHLDSKQWSQCSSVNLDGAVEVNNEIYFPATTNTPRTNPSVPVPGGAFSISATFDWDIYRTALGNTTSDYTTKFNIRFVKKLVTEDGKGGHFRFLKLYFREMNFTSITVRYYNNYDFADNSEYFEATYDDIVTFQEDGVSAYSRYVCFLMIPVEAARGEWLSFEIFNTVSSGVDILKYNGILLEGVELVTTAGRSASV